MKYFDVVSSVCTSMEGILLLFVVNRMLYVSLNNKSAHVN